MQTKDGDSWKDRLSVVYDEDAGEFDILLTAIVVDIYGASGHQCGDG